MLQVLRIQGFIAFITVVFLNAFVDLGHKIIIQNTVFKIYDGDQQIILTAIVNALILLPFVMMFTPAGYLADKYPKHQIMRFSAWGATILTLLITFSYYQGWFWFGFGMTFLLAMQSAFYGPAKLGYIRELVGDSQLPQGNAMAQSTAMIAILLSTFFFSILFEILLENFVITDEASVLQQIAPLGWLLVGFTLLELWVAYRIPKAGDTNPAMQFEWDNYLRGKTARKNLNRVWNNELIWLTIIGVSLFWAISQVVLATYPAFAKMHLGITSTAELQGIIAFAGIGIMLGSLVAGQVSKNHIETGLIPIGAMGVAITIALISLFESPLMQALNFLVLGVMGGLFLVPLNALMQYHAPKDQLGRVLASFNLVSNVMMLGFLGLTILAAILGFDSIYMFAFLVMVALAGAAYTIYRLPQSLLRFVISRMFHARYRLKVQGFENLPPDGGVLLLGNHISYIDWALLQMATPRSLKFVVENEYYERWYLSGLLKMMGVVQLRSNDKAQSMQQMKELLQAGKAVCLFPEGAISRTGQLSAFSRDYETAIEGTDAVIVPFYLHGLWSSRFSRSSGFLRQSRQSGFKRDVVVSFGEVLSASTSAHQLKQRVFDLSFSSWEAYAESIDPVPVNWIRVASRNGFRLAAADVEGEPLSNNRFVTAVIRFSALIKKYSPEQNVGLLLPTSVGSNIANMAVLSLGKTVVNLNYTASAEALKSAVEQAEIQHIYTSKLFVKRLKERGIDIEVIFADTPLIYLESLKKEITKLQLLLTLIMVVVLPGRLLQWLFVQPINLNSTAAILFSSGSEGAPKGVQLSHRNLAANSRQVADTLNTLENDVIMGTLPAFHAFGLLAGVLLPLSEGIPVVSHPDPMDAETIAKGVARYEATVLFGTATFLRLYARNKRVHPLMFQSLRYVVAGAEKLPADVRRLFMDRFGKAIMEGYGTTETSPVAAVNMPDKLESDAWQIQPGTREGTVGLPVPGTSFHIVDPDTLQELAVDEDGLILIGGPQVMQGYLNEPEKTADVIVELDGRRWYKSGDKGHVDKDGFLTIVDRYSRFAKLGGEMVSLSAVEQQIREIMNEPEMDLVAVNLPDAKKGEKVVILLAGDYDSKQVRRQLIDAGMNPLMIPAAFYRVDEVPKLGSGKTDFVGARRLTEKCV
uniref:2-acylglycerophosphoethanolamine acyltransferase / acyl-acyl carrier protein synthetase (EC) n=1 Tax=uncultured Thiotrichaceae bacterium TaxID=298394 RepID=A0A6S6SFF5_9GAMM|nr:MAG: Putative 2-acylglycerophosphoethanolamine acyltransferase / acyl-acyl carrier protein synthetase (EC [uncultured Thiotrichaceae bacterium]